MYLVNLLTSIIVTTMMQVGVDVSGEAVQRAGRKLVAAYRQADDPLSLPLHHWQPLAQATSNPTGDPPTKQLPSSQLYHGDIATANAAKPGMYPLVCVLLASLHS